MKAMRRRCPLTVRETRRHAPDPENQAAYDKAYHQYRRLYESLKDMMKKRDKHWLSHKEEEIL